MNEKEKIKDLKAVYSGAVQAGEIGIANMIKGGIDLIEKQQKEKLINTLVDFIAKEDIDELVCKHIKCVDNEEETNCRECVKKFFESKIKESEN